MVASFIPSLLDKLDNINITNPASCQVLTHNGIEWVNAQLAHSNLSDIATNYHAVINTHIGGNTIHFPEASVNHLDILNVGTNKHTKVNTHIANTSDLHIASLTQANLTITDAFNNDVCSSEYSLPRNDIIGVNPNKIGFSNAYLSGVSINEAYPSVHSLPRTDIIGANPNVITNSGVSINDVNPVLLQSSSSFAKTDLRVNSLNEISSRAVSRCDTYPSMAIRRDVNLINPSQGIYREADHNMLKPYGGSFSNAYPSGISITGINPSGYNLLRTDGIETKHNAVIHNGFACLRMASPSNVNLTQFPHDILRETDLNGFNPYGASFIETDLKKDNLNLRKIDCVAGTIAATIIAEIRETAKKIVNKFFEQNTRILDEIGELKRLQAKNEPVFKEKLKKIGYLVVATIGLAFLDNILDNILTDYVKIIFEWVKYCISNLK